MTVILKEFKLIKDSLDAYLDEVVACSSFLERSLDLRPHIYTMLDNNALDDSKRELVNSFYSHSDLRIDLTHRSVYASNAAYFENFIRKIAIAAIKIQNRKKIKVEKAKVKLIDENIYRSGQALSSIRSPHTYHKFDHSSIADAILNNADNTKELILHPEALVINAGSTTDKNIENLFARGDIIINWDNLCKKSELSNFFSIKGPRETSKETKLRLNNMVEHRNRIAHQGASASDIEYQDLNDQIKFISAFSTDLLKFLSL